MSNVPMTLPELVIAAQNQPFSHSSSFVELDDGRILHVCHGVYNYSEDGGVTWTGLEWLKDANGAEMAVRSVVRLSGRNAIGAVGEPSRYQMAFYRSQDGGQTWGEPIPINPVDPLIPRKPLMDVALRTSSGRIIVPGYVFVGQRSKTHPMPDGQPFPMSGKLDCNQWVGTGAHFFDSQLCANFVYYSDDEGLTWKPNADGLLYILMDWNTIFSGVSEPSVAEVKPGTLLMMMRTGLGRLFQAWSYDDGETWTRPMPTSLANTEAPAQIRTLPNGHLLCIWNQENEEEVRKGWNRTRLSAAISRNGGSVWEFFQNIESLHESTRVEPGPIHPVRPEEIYFLPGQPAAQRDPAYVHYAREHGRWSYPMVEVLKDRVIVAYSYRYYTEDPERAQLSEAIDSEGQQWVSESAHQRRKILPLKWFYGGKEPADNPFLPKAYDPAQP